MSGGAAIGRRPADAIADPALAINGGQPLAPDGIAPAHPLDLEPAIATIAETLRRDGTLFAWYGGSEQRRFEAEFAELTGARHAVLCASGTSALHLCLQLLGVGPGTVVAVPSFGFVSCVTTVMQLGAQVRLLPIDPTSLVVTLDSCGDLLGGCDLLLAVHALGYAVDVAGFRDRHAELVVLEDAAEAQGTTFDGVQVGTDGAAACWSLTTTHNELHGAAVAGVVTTDDRALANRCRRLVHYGKDHRSIVPGTGLNPPPAEMGFNCLSSEAEAAVARVALAAFGSRAAARSAAGQLLVDGLAERGHWTPTPDRRCVPNHYDVAFGLDDAWTPHRDWVLDALVAEGMPAWTYYSLAGMPWFETWMRERGWWGAREDVVRSSDAPIVNRLVAIRPSMRVADVELVLASVDKVLGRC